MEVAYDNILEDHLGIKTITDKVLSSFYWPGIQSDVTRYCRSCDVCQRPVHNGKVTKVPLEKRLRQFIRHLRKGIATRYPESVPLKNISTEVVAETWVNIYRF